MTEDPDVMTIDPKEFDYPDGQQANLRYNRVIPRDLFNEANLFKCMGRVALNILGHPHLHVKYHLGEPFVCGQYDMDGSITPINVTLYCKNIPIRLTRPLNSRAAWPLYAFDSMDDDEIEVFTEDGEFTSDFNEFVETLESIQPHWERPDDALP